jgi:ABC-type uncharacterized transport system permease subunit
MNAVFFLKLSALISLVPATVYLMRPGRSRDGTFWMLLLVAVIGPSGVAVNLLWQGWLTSLFAALWTSIAASLIVFLIVCLVTRQGWRLTLLLLPYLLLFGIGAVLSEASPDARLSEQPLTAWLDVHIALSIATYGLLTMAAIAGFAVILQEASLKRRRLTWLSERLPAIAEAESLQIALLGVTAVVLGFGLITGAINQLRVSGAMLAWNHKTLLTLLGFAVIAALLVLHLRTGLRGRRAAQWILVAYLMLTLGYPGVKFVRDLILT